MKTDSERDYLKRRWLGETLVCRDVGGGEVEIKTKILLRLSMHLLILGNNFSQVVLL